MKNTYLKEPDRGTPVDPQRLIKGIVDRDVVVPKFLSQCLLGLGLIEVGRRRAGLAQPLLQVRNGDVRHERCGVGRRSLSIVRWVLRHHAAILPHH
jgi:hypothetical protein